jgi:hypothetical protein
MTKTARITVAVALAILLVLAALAIVLAGVAGQPNAAVFVADDVVAPVFAFIGGVAVHLFNAVASLF